MEKTGFKDPIAIKNEEPKNTPRNGKNTPWDYRQPEYDERSSCFVNAGTHYGVGNKQPVGSHGTAKSSDVVPKGRINTLRVDEKG